jgi:hypothetical protein
VLLGVGVEGDSSGEDLDSALKDVKRSDSASDAEEVFLLLCTDELLELSALLSLWNLIFEGDDSDGTGDGEYRSSSYCRSSPILLIDSNIDEDEAECGALSPIESFRRSFFMNELKSLSNIE